MSPLHSLLGGKNKQPIFSSQSFLGKKGIQVSQTAPAAPPQERGKATARGKKIWKEVVALTSRLEGSVERKVSQSGREVAEEKHYAYVHAHMQMQIYQGLVRRR